MNGEWWCNCMTGVGSIPKAYYYNGEDWKFCPYCGRARDGGVVIRLTVEEARDWAAVNRIEVAIKGQAGWSSGSVAMARQLDAQRDKWEKPKLKVGPWKVKEIKRDWCKIGCEVFKRDEIQFAVTFSDTSSRGKWEEHCIDFEWDGIDKKFISPRGITFTPDELRAVLKAMDEQGE